MPVVYEIDEAARLLRTRCVGLVTMEEVIGHFDALENDPTCPEHLDVLLNLDDMDTIPDSGNIAGVTKRISELRSLRFRACAVVASRDAVFGMARMFEVLAESHFTATQVFRDTESAVEWLRSVGQPSS
jgi:hypothetical protein